MITIAVLIGLLMGGALTAWIILEEKRMRLSTALTALFFIGWLLVSMTGCASMLPTQVVDGVSVYIRDTKYVDDYCRARTPADQSIPGRSMGGCYIPKDRLIMVAEGPRQAAVLAHELRHAGGEEHVGACSAVAGNPVGVKPNGSPCEWYRK